METVKTKLPPDLCREAKMRGRRARTLNFDSALNIELNEYGRRYLNFFLWGYLK